MGLLWFVIAIAAVVVVAAISIKLFVFIVQQNTVIVVTRLGKHSRVLSAGPNFRIPLIDRRYRTYSSARKTIFLSISGDARGGPVELCVDLEVHGSIHDPHAVARLAYEVDEPLTHLRTVATQAVRQIVLPLTFTEVLTQGANGMLGDRLKEALAEIAASCGFTIIAVRITSVQPERSVREAILATARGDEERKNDAAQADLENVLRTQRAESAASATAIAAAAENDRLRAQVSQISELIKLLTRDGSMTIEQAVSVVNAMLHQQVLMAAVDGGAQVNVLPASIANTGAFVQPHLVDPRIPGTSMPNER